MVVDGMSSDDAIQTTLEVGAKLLTLPFLHAVGPTLCCLANGLYDNVCSVHVMGAEVKDWEAPAQVRKEGIERSACPEESKGGG